MVDRLARRLQAVPPTIFTRMSALAVRTGSLNLGQGYPDQDGPQGMLDVAAAAVLGGRNQYAPGPGIPELRQAVARHQARCYGIGLDPDQLRHVVSDRTRVLVLNTPHNPTGAVLGTGELAAVAEVARRHDVVVVVDEVYEHLTYDGRRHVPLASLPGMAERTVSVSSAGKTFSCTGWKVGWATGSPELVRTVLAAKQWLTFTNAAPLQPAVAHALENEEAYVEALAAQLASGRDLLVQGLAELGLDPVVPHGSYFTLGDVTALGWD